MKSTVTDRLLGSLLSSRHHTLRGEKKPQNHKNPLKQTGLANSPHLSGLLCSSCSACHFSCLAAAQEDTAHCRAAELNHSSHTACPVPSCMESLSKGAQPHPASSSAATRSLPANKVLPTSSQRGTRPCHSGWHTKDPGVWLPEEALQWQRLYWRQSLLFTGETTC